MSTSERGATLYEATILITAMATMTAVAAPVGGSMIDRARVVSASQQVSALASAMDLLLADQYGRLPLDQARLLVSDGEIPASAQGVWGEPVDGSTVLPLGGVLYENSFGLPEPSSPVEFGWSGPYMQKQIGPDPWGNRYAVSVGDTGPVMILSAGPDGAVQTPSEHLAPGQSDADDLVFVIRS